MELTVIIQSKIYEIRGQQVMLDRDLADLYGVETKVLNQSVKRNIERFPDDFMFQLTKRRNSKLEVTTCDLQFYQNGIKTKSLCIYRIGSRYVK